MEVLYLVKIFDIEFSPNLRALRSSESRKWFLKIGLCVLVCVYVRTYECGCMENIQLFMYPNLIKIETANFIHSTDKCVNKKLAENQETRSGVG